HEDVDVGIALGQDGGLLDPVVHLDRAGVSPLGTIEDDAQHAVGLRRVEPARAEIDRRHATVLPAGTAAPPARRAALPSAPGLSPVARMTRRRRVLIVAALALAFAAPGLAQDDEEADEEPGVGVGEPEASAPPVAPPASETPVAAPQNVPAPPNFQPPQ